MSSLPLKEPPDGGWGWFVVLSGFLANSFTYGILRSLGVLLEDLMNAFDATVAQISWVTAIALAVQQFASPLGTAVSVRYGARPVVMLGGFLSSLGLLWASFSTSLLQLYLSLGFLTGFLRDMTGDFTASFLVGGAFVLCASVVFLALPSSFTSCRSGQNNNNAVPSVKEESRTLASAPFVGSVPLTSECSQI